MTIFINTAAKNTFHPLIILMLSVVITFGQRVDSIKIQGNHHTRDNIILREIQHPMGASFVPDIAMEDRNRLYNLGLFSTVDIYQVNNTYMVNLVEGPAQYPIPILDYDEAKGQKGWSYGVGLVFLNFRGLDEDLFGGFTTGNVHNYLFSYYNPWIFGDHISFGVDYWDLTNTDAVYNYVINHQHLSLYVGKKKGEFVKFQYSIGYDQMNIHWNVDSSDQANYSNSDRDYNYLQFGSEIEFDSRDIIIDPNLGSYSGLSYHFNLAMNDVANYSELDIWYKKWIKLFDSGPEPVLSFSVSVENQYSNNLPLFRHKFLGGNHYIRGYSPIPVDNPEIVRPLLENHSIIFYHISLQQTLVPKIDIGGIELGADWYLFYNAGVAYKNLHEINYHKLVEGFGIGLIFFTTGIGSVSIDFAFNPYEPDMHLHLSDSD